MGQYEFLRTQYPGSSLRVTALLAEAQIEANDLGDLAAAKEKYTLFLKQYPKSGHAEEARAGLDALSQVQGTGYKVQGQVQGTGDKVQSLPKNQAARTDVPASAVVTSGKGAGASSLGATPVTRGATAPVVSGPGGTSGGDSERRGVAAPVDAELDGVALATVPGAGTSSGGVSNVSGGLRLCGGVGGWRRLRGFDIGLRRLIRGWRSILGMM